MRQLWLTPGYAPALGGIETSCRLQAEQLTSLGDDVLVLTDDSFGENGVINGVEVVRLPFLAALRGNPLQLLQVQRRVREHAQRFQPDLVQLHLLGFAPPAFAGLPLKRDLGLPLLVTMHDDLAQARVGPDTLLGQVLAAADAIVAHSTLFGNEVLRLLPEAADRLTVIYPALPAPPQPLQPLDPAAVPRNFIGIGRVVRGKGMDTAVRALALLDGDAADVTLTIVGDGPQLAEWQALAGQLGIAERLHWAGRVDEATKVALIDQALAVVMPSRHREGYGLVALEAALRARPLLATAAGSLQETVAELGHGLTVPIDDPAALAAAMRQLLDHPQLAAELGARGAQAAAARHTPLAHTLAYRAVAEQLLLRGTHD
jgi:glycogen synthase